MKRFWMRAVVLVFACLTGLAVCRADELAAVTGLVTDPNGRSVPGVTIVVTNLATNVASRTVTNDQGIYRVPSLQPGIYRMTLDKDGFKSVVKSGVELHVQDVASINFELQIGSVNETVTVEAGGLVINTTDAAVSTVIDRNFAERLPLNGRSFNTLLQLTPGVVIAPSRSVSSPGQFSIGGQRTDANNFLIDGVSANFGIASTPGTTGSGTGSSQAFSVLGGTSSLVSVEALQEFRIETSSYAPEFGRSPGGQVILTTRPGTNSFHGGVYNYFRNDVLDANDWFANQAGNPRAAERHNDFGGYLGGPIWKDKTFFFLSYEGARLRVPRSKEVKVPSVTARQNAPATIAPILNAYPVPKGPVSPGGFTATFAGTFSDSATLNAGSIRIDHAFNDRFSIFGRYNDAPSQSVVRTGGLSTLGSTEVDTQTITVGANMALSSRLYNSLRGNYSTQNSSGTSSLDSFGGAVPVNASVFLGSLSSASNQYLFQPGGGTSFFREGLAAGNRTKQLNIADDLGLTLGVHQLKFGADYRAILQDLNPQAFLLSYFPTSVQNFVSTSAARLSAQSRNASRILDQSLSLYVQDSWKLARRLTLTYGVRWELSPAPTGRDGTVLAAWTNVNTPANIALAPSGSPIWKTTYGNFAPRAGFAYSLTSKGDFVLRAGAGIFYDLGVETGDGVASSFPNFASGLPTRVSLPIGNITPFLPVIQSQPPFPNGIFAFDPNLKLPRSYQWNVALEKSFAGKQALSVSYVGQAGRDLLRREGLFMPNSSFSGEFQLNDNSARSNYNALQLQYRRPLSAHLQALANYTWSHSLDNASDDLLVGLANTIISGASDYASSGFDVRHGFSVALSYDIPSIGKSGPLSLLTRDWSLDAVIVARSGFPFNAFLILESADPGGFAFSRPDRVLGQPLWISAPNAPGGKILNSTTDPITGAVTGGAFAIPPTTPAGCVPGVDFPCSAARQGTEGRNDIPGFGLTQVDLSIGRKFPITERLNLQFRADAFNVLNHPNFQNPSDPFFELGPFFLQSQGMFNGAGGLNPLFQQGGPRSLQLSLKLIF